MSEVSSKVLKSRPGEFTAAQIADGNDRAVGESILLKIRSTELLPELFGLLLDIEQGQMQAKDFDNNLGTTRLKIETLILRLKDLEGICDSIRDQKTRVLSLLESKKAKKELLNEFREQVLLKLNQGA